MSNFMIGDQLRILPGCTSEDKNTHKKLVLVYRLVYDPVRSKHRRTRSDLGVTGYSWTEPHDPDLLLLLSPCR
jgi:hypothetical protein